MYIELGESGEKDTMEVPLITLELIVKCDGLKYSLMSQLLKIYSVSPLRSALRSHAAKEDPRIIFIDARRENAADLYRGAANLHVPISARVKNTLDCIPTRGRGGERTKRSHHEGCCRRCELTFRARDKKASSKRRVCKQPRYTHRSPRIKRLSREAIREQLARMIHGG